jgi:amidase
MPNNPDRRAVIAGAGATAAIAASAMQPNQAAATTEPAPYRTAGALLKALADRQVSSRELVDASIARIEALDPKLNAVVVRDFARARDAAAAADAAIARGETRPLLGLPMTVKEQFNIVGLPTTWGFPKDKGWMPAADALVIQRIKAAGAVILGKTNVPVNLGDWQSYNDIYGTTNNPWDPSRSPGGSSGGSAAALAAGFTSVEFGSDIGGSLRCPAHFCGVFSHKPSLDLVPSRGAGPPMTPEVPVRGDLAVIGPMARSAADLALLLGVTAGPDPIAEGIGYKLALPPPRHDKLSDFRVLVIDKHPLCPTATDVTGALNARAEALGKAGVKIIRSSEKLPDLALTSRVYKELLTAVFGADLPPEVRARVEARVKELPSDDESLDAAGLRGITISHPDWVHQSRIRGGLRARWYALFDEVDIILCPPTPTVAFPHDHSPQGQRKLDVDGAKIPYNDQSVWAGIATMNGLPSTTLPIGRNDKGLPIGMQVVGNFLNDHTTIAFAEMVEREFGGFTPPPGY